MRKRICAKVKAVESICEENLNVLQLKANMK